MSVASSGRRWIARAAFLTAVLTLLPDCGSSRHSEPLVGPLTMSRPEQLAGQRVFLEFCNQCHPGGEAGLGPPTTRLAVPDAVLRTQVREGLGAMPAFSKDEISDQELEELVAYIVALREHGS